MTYNKNIWQNGDVITAEKLNNIEDNVEKIFSNMGYSTEINKQSIFQGTVVISNDSQAPFPTDSKVIDQVITCDTIKVTFNGISYIINKEIFSTGSEYETYIYGEHDGPYPKVGDKYPFSLQTPISQGKTFLTAINGTHQIEIESFEKNITISDDFKESVKIVYNELYPVKIVYTNFTDYTYGFYDRGEKLTYDKLLELTTNNTVIAVPSPYVTEFGTTLLMCLEDTYNNKNYFRANTYWIQNINNTPTIKQHALILYDDNTYDRIEQ